VRFFFHQVARNDIPIELAARRLDFAIDIASVAQGDVESVPLVEDRYVCVLRRGHPAAKQRLTLSRFRRVPDIAVSSRRGGRTVADLALHKLGERLRPMMRFAHYTPAFHVVATTDCALVAPASVARVHDVVVRPLPFDTPSLALDLHWRRDTHHDPASVWARALLVDAARRA
jgi:DNA-binding transcriptional LysR family regulator